LKKEKSVAVTDNIFLKAYFAMVIKAKELHQEVKKGLMKDSSSRYYEIIENIHAGYQVHTTVDHIRNTSDLVPGVLIIQQGKMEDKGGKPIGLSGANVTSYTLNPVKFPNNTGQLLPSEYYSQFRDWYSQMVKALTDRSLDYITWISNFKFDFEGKSFQ